MLKRGILSILVYGSIIGAAAFHSVEMMFGTGMLVMVIHGLLWMILNNGKIIFISSVTSLKTSSTVSQSTKNRQQSSDINDKIFQQFQNNLQDYQKKHAGVSPAAPLKQRMNSIEEPSSFSEQLAWEDQDQDQVRLSSRAIQQKRTPSVQRQSTEVPPKSDLQPSPTSRRTPPPVAPPKTVVPLQASTTPLRIPSVESSRKPVELGDDLFADVFDPLSNTSPAETNPPLSSSPVISQELDEAFSDVPDRNDLTEAMSLLHMGQIAYQSGRFLEAKALIENHFSILTQKKQPISWRTQYLYAKICLKEGLVDQSIQYFSKLLKNGQAAEEEDYGRILEEVLVHLQQAQQVDALLPFAFALLNVYREQLNRPQMDTLYFQIEKALESVGDEKRLVQTYKNHIEIKRALKDPYGESQLLDWLGNRYYKMGEKELSRQYYEENLKLKASLKL